MSTRCPRCGNWFDETMENCPDCGFDIGSNRDFTESNVSSNPL